MNILQRLSRSERKPFMILTPTYFLFYFFILLVFNILIHLLVYCFVSFIHSFIHSLIVFLYLMYIIVQNVYLLSFYNNFLSCPQITVLRLMNYINNYFK